jgi:hypothetical protein
MNHNTIKALLETHLANYGSPKLNNQSLEAATDYLTIFLETAIRRMITEGRVSLEENINSSHLTAILPQLLLDC